MSVGVLDWLDPEHRPKYLVHQEENLSAVTMEHLIEVVEMKGTLHGDCQLAAARAEKLTEIEQRTLRRLLF